MHHAAVNGILWRGQVALRQHAKPDPFGGASFLKIGLSDNHSCIFTEIGADG